ncbi:MAG: hypothetical protein IT310_14640 [Anaerolineales bacterium]|nr:hypothetical protein [Anaerolineales bacterium]
MTKPPFASFLTFSLLALSGIFLILYATPQGLILSDDSIAYIAGARSILSGQGYREAWLASNGPVTHFPPFFSAALAMLGVAGLDPLRGARFLNALIFGANVFLLGLIGWRMTKTQIGGVALAALGWVNYSLFRVHATAMSEPLYIFLTLAAFLTFDVYFQRKQKRWLIITGGLVGLAYLTRYAGLALFATFLVSLFLLDRLSRAAWFGLSFLPFALGWAARNQLVAHNATNRALGYHPLTVENLQTGLYNLSLFLMPVEAWRKALMKTPEGFNLLIFSALLAVLIWLLQKGLTKFFRPATQTPEILSFISALYIFGYLASILSSMLLFDASTKFQLRILAPIFVSVLILAVYFLAQLWRKQMQIAAGLFIIIFLLSSYGAQSMVVQLHKGGQGYASFQWYDSDALKFLRNLPAGVRIYTNEAGPVYLYTQRGAYVLPDLVDPVTGQARGGFEEGKATLQAEVLSGQAVLALFDVGKDDQTRQLYQQLGAGLYLAFDKQGDTIYTAYP